MAKPGNDDTQGYAVGAPYQRKRSGKWYFSATCGGRGDGKQKEFGPYQDEKSAKRERTRYQNRQVRKLAADATKGVAGIPEFDGSLSWWRDLLGRLARRVAAGGTPGERADLKTIASAALSAARLHDPTELEARLERLEGVEKTFKRKARQGASVDDDPLDALVDEALADLQHAPGTRQPRKGPGTRLVS